MNLPNKLTILRIVLVPVMVATLLLDFEFHFIASGVLFAAAAITDFFDGLIARKNNLVTNFGKFADPIADKILVISALVCFQWHGLCDPIVVIIVLFREFVVTSVRLSAAANGKVVAANIWGKLKTVSQMFAIVLVFALQMALEIIDAVYGAKDALALSSTFYYIGEIALWISTVFVIMSGIKYVIDNKDAISDM